MLTVTERRRWRRSALLAFASVPTAKLNLPAGADARVWRPMRTSLLLFPPESALRRGHSDTPSREPASLTRTLPRTRVPFCDFAIATIPDSVVWVSVVPPGPGAGVGVGVGVAPPGSVVGVGVAAGTTWIVPIMVALCNSHM